MVILLIYFTNRRTVCSALGFTCAFAMLVLRHASEMPLVLGTPGAGAPAWWGCGPLQPCFALKLCRKRNSCSFLKIESLPLASLTRRTREGCWDFCPGSLSFVLSSLPALKGHPTPWLSQAVRQDSHPWARGWAGLSSHPTPL